MNFISNLSLDLSVLSEKELDFYNFTVSNYHLIIKNNLDTIKNVYGVGMSFIYNFFKKLKVSGIKEYIYRLGIINGLEMGKGYVSDQKSPSAIRLLQTIQNNYQLSNTINMLWFQEQIDKFNQLILKINISHKIYGFGMGHSLIALNDLFGMLSLFNYNIEILERNRNIQKNKLLSIKENDLLIIMSMCGLHTFTKKLVALLKTSCPDLMIVLLTSNQQSPLIPLVTLSIFIDNQIRRINDLDNNLLFSPLWDMLFFVDYVKNLVYLQNKQKIEQNSNFNQEMASWRTNKKME